MNLSIDPGTIIMHAPIEFYRLGATIPVDGNTPVASTPPAAPESDSSSSTATISSEGQFLSNLQTLQTAQPQQFQAALSQAASGLQDAAQQAGTSTPHGQLLSKSATTIQQVATSGNVGLLQPPPAANAVEKAFSSNQADAGHAILALLAKAQTQPSTASSSASVISGLLSSAGKSSGSSAGNTVEQIVNRIVQNLQKAVSSSSAH
jgi:hypothetical protein